MPQIAGFRGIVASAAKLAAAAAAPTVSSAAIDVTGGARDASRAVYRYHQVFEGPGGRSVTRKMFLCALRLAPWSDGSVRPHALADDAVRAAELARIRAGGSQGGAVLAGFRDAPGEVDRLFRKVEGAAPTLETRSPDGTVHRIWRMQDAEAFGKLRHAMAPKRVHLLDGHARYEAMLAYSDELGAKAPLAQYASANYGLACLVELGDPGLVVAARHRMLRVPGGAPPRSEPVLAAVRATMIVDRIAGGATNAAAALAALAETVAHQPAFVVAFAGEPDAWKLTLKPDVSPAAEGVTVHRAVHKLEPYVIEHLFVDRALEGATSTSTTNATVALGALAGPGGQGGAPRTADAALLTRALSLTDILRVDEHEQRLPAHATAFHPPLLDGLVHLPIDPDEDLV
ncbi:MAG: DUF1015 family protein [Deltaproteobacteria bacterium]|nr:DUF1015 family protein [Deltaproteobacteria bacterium]